MIKWLVRHAPTVWLLVLSIIAFSVHFLIFLGIH